MTRRKLLTILVVVAGLGIGLSPLTDAPPLETGAYLQAVTTDSARVLVATAEPTEFEVVVLRDSATVATARDTAPVTHHEFALAGLSAATRYRFELRDTTGAVIDGGDFTTRSDRDDAKFRFAVLGDSGGQPWWIALQHAPLFRLVDAQRWLWIRSEPRAVARLLSEAAPSFWLHVGDVIYPDGSQEGYHTGFFAPFGDVLRHAPCFPVLGNHDLMTEEGAAFFTNFALPESPLGERCFTFRDGPLRVIGLDLNNLVHDDNPSIGFLKATMAECSEPLVVVTNHYPSRTVYRDEPRADMVGYFMPLCRELGVDVVFAGHDHNYQRFGQPGETIEVVTGGGGKSLYEIKHQPDGLVAAVSEYHASIVDVAGNTLTLTARSIDGAVIDSFSIDKAAELRNGTLRASPARTARIRALAGE